MNSLTAPIKKINCGYEYLGLICVEEGIVYSDVRIVHLAVLVDVAQAAHSPHEHQVAHHVGYQVARPLGFTGLLDPRWLLVFLRDVICKKQVQLQMTRAPVHYRINNFSLNEIE